MQRIRYTDTGLPAALIFGLMATFILGLTHTGQQLRAEFLSSIPVGSRVVAPAPPARPHVVVVSVNRDRQDHIAATVTPRGYQVLLAETAADGQKILRADRGAIGVVVVDMELADGGGVARLAHSLIPAAKVLQLRPSMGAGDVAVALLSAL